MSPTRALFQAATATTPKYIPPFSSTGITGLVAHPFPRPVLIGLYAHTLNTLSSFPAHSVYRTSTENLTKSRLSIIESITPPGYDEYSSKIAPIKEKYREILIGKSQPNLSLSNKEELKLKAAIASAQIRGCVKKTLDDMLAAEVSEENLEATVIDVDERLGEIELSLGMIPDALPKHSSGKDKNSEKLLPDQTEDQANAHTGDDTFGDRGPSIPPAGKVSPASSESAGLLPEFPPEPPLTADQVAELENKIGAGLIEEIINQGLSELKLIEEMKNYKPWEGLEEVPMEGQWRYFERNP